MTAPGPRAVTLTPTQHKVLTELVRDGATNATIAARLHVTEDTVKSHVKNLLLAIGVDNRTAAVVAVLRRHVLVQPPARNGWVK